MLYFQQFLVLWSRTLTFLSAGRIFWKAEISQVPRDTGEKQLLPGKTACYHPDPWSTTLAGHPNYMRDCSKYTFSCDSGSLDFRQDPRIYMLNLSPDNKVSQNGSHLIDNKEFTGRVIMPDDFVQTFSWHVKTVVYKLTSTATDPVTPGKARFTSFMSEGTLALTWLRTWRFWVCRSENTIMFIVLN